ncbi:MAG: chloride channel protein [Planctomycetaceae bacterium]
MRRVTPFRFLDGFFVGMQRGVVGLVLLVGLASGLVGAFYLWVLHVLQRVLWPTEWQGFVGFAILGGVGLVVALLTRFVGSPGDVELMVDNIHVSGTAMGMQTLRSLIPISWLCIASGGAMGPEAPLVQTTGSLASWAASRAKLEVQGSRVLTISGMAAGFSVLFGAPLGAAVFSLEILHRRGLQYYEAVLPAVIGSLSGYVVYVAVARRDLTPVFHLSAPATLPMSQLGWAAAAGVAGAGVATAFTYLSTALRWVAHRLRPELRPVLGGLLLAGLGLLSTYSLTFGEGQIADILTRHGETVAFFALAALAKLAGTSVTLSGEWRGGFIIPLFFVGACVGRALHVLAPGANEAVLVAALMASSNAGVTKTPLGSTLVVTEMTGLSLLPTTLLAAVVTFVLTSGVRLIHTQRERGSAGGDADAF